MGTFHVNVFGVPATLFTVILAGASGLKRWWIRELLTPWSPEACSRNLALSRSKQERPESLTEAGWNCTLPGPGSQLGGGRNAVARVSFGPEGTYLMGSTTLEDMGLVVDPVDQRLAPQDDLLM